MSGSASTPLPPSGPGPQRTVSSRNSMRSNPASRPSTPAVLASREDRDICRLASHAAITLDLNRDSFPTLFAEPILSEDLSDGERRIIPLLSHLVAQVRHLSEEVATLSALRPAPATTTPAPPPPPCDPAISAALRDLKSQVSSLASRPPLPPALPAALPPPPPPQPGKKLLLKGQKALSIPSADFPIHVSGQWYGSPEVYARANNHTREASVFFASVNPSGGEASFVAKKGRYPVPISQHFLPGPPPGYVVDPSLLSQEGGSWAQVAGKGKRVAGRATAAQVASASASSPISPASSAPPPPLPAAQRRFYAPRLNPAPFDDPINMAAALPDMMASVLRQAGCSHPVSFSASVNSNGAVTLTANPRTPSSAYSPFFAALTKKLNQSFSIGENPFQEFRTAPLFTDLLIHNLPLALLPSDPADLFPRLRESILNATDVSILSARYLQRDDTIRNSKLTTLVVVSAAPQDLPALGPDLHRNGAKIRLFNRLRDIHLAHPASRDTQCKKCFRFGHSKPLCKADHETCPICARPHSRSKHRCANEACPKQGNIKVVPDCCAATRPLCVNCDDEHPATSLNCPVRVAIREAIRPTPRDQELPDAPPSRHPTPTPGTPPRQPQPGGPLFPPSTVRRAPTSSPSLRPPAGPQQNPFFQPLSGRPTVANPIPTRALFPPLDPTTDWSEDQLPDNDDAL